MGLKPRKGMSATRIVKALEDRRKGYKDSIEKWKKLDNETGVDMCMFAIVVIDSILAEIATGTLTDD